MDLANILNWETLILPIITTTVLIGALTITFDKFFASATKKKILTLIVAFVVSLVYTELSWVEWQSMLSGWFLTFGLSVLVYQYLGGEWLKRWIQNKLK